MFMIYIIYVLTITGALEFHRLCNKVNAPTRHKINWKFFESELYDYPDQQYAQCIVETAKNGFHYGIEGNTSDLLTHTTNLPTAYQFPKELDEILIKELRLGRIFCDDKFPVKAQVKIGTVPKPNGKRRLIRHGSFPYYGTSINSLIQPECAYIKLPSLNNICEIFSRVGKNGWIGKEDLKSAYRQFGTHYTDWPYITYKHRGRTLIDTRTGDGIRSSGSPCQIFGNAIIYIVNKRLPPKLQGNIVNYIDDYIFAAPTKLECIIIRDTLRNVLNEAGIEYSPDKAQLGQQLKVLGYFYNMIELIVKLDDKRKQSWKQQILKCINATELSYSDIEQLIGKLEYAARVAWPLRAFISRLRQILPPQRIKHQMIPIPEIVRCDMKMWMRYLDSLNGLRLDLVVSEPTSVVPFTSDASKYAYGAFMPPMWIFGEFQQTELGQDIYWKEMFAICAAFNAWARMWSGLKILITTDNESIYWPIRKKYSPVKFLADAICFICELSIKYQFRFWIIKTKSKNNFFSDALSRMKFNEFTDHCKKWNMPYNNQPTPFDRPNINIIKQNNALYLE